MQRAIGYNSTKIRIFEQVLKKELFTEDGHRRSAAENIFNVDETELTVNQKPRKVIAKRGKKSVSVIKSVEKGKTITAVCCISAVGVYCPPFLVFPRKRFKPELLDRGPVGAVGVANGLMRQHFHNGSIIFSTLFNLSIVVHRVCSSWMDTAVIPHTHTQPLYGSVEFVRENPGEPVPEETFTHYSHRSHQSSLSAFSI